ncbi:MAG: hypothetical protein HY537_17165 [Deltaproteobacteria bacterium]|nr:hypothetical protein [Deltaproteobacteria bacterium]
MNTQSGLSKLIASVVILMMFFQSTATLALKDKTEFGSNVREYFTSNPDGRFLVRVQLWGDIPLSGTHYVPDNTSLLDLIGYAGGTSGNFSNSKIFVRRIQGEKNQLFDTPSVTEIQGRNLLELGQMEKFRLKNGDIVVVETDKPSTTFMGTLTTVMTVTGAVTSFITLYLLAKSLK